MRKIILILFAAAAFASCTRERIADDGPQPSDGQMVEVSMKAASATRAAIAEEDIVESLDLLVFKADGFLYWRSAYKLGGKFRATLTIDNGLDVHFIANARERIDALSAAGELTAGAPWETLRLKLTDTDPSKFNYTAASQIKLPMWGVLKDKNVEDVPINYWGTLDLLRSVASVDVSVSDAVDDDIFTLEEIRLYFVPDRGFLAPAASNVDATGLAVKAAQAPVGMVTMLTLTSSAYDEVSKSIANKLYLYDNDTGEDNRTNLPDKTHRHTRLVVGGTYKSAKYYYPIDFETDDDRIDQITRNWKYIFMINSVTSAGYESPETASEEPPIGMNVSVVKWNEKQEGDFWVSGPYYVGLTGSRDIVLARPQGSTAQIGVRSNIEADLILMAFKQGSVNGATEDIPDGIRNDRFQVVKVKDANGRITGIEFTALQDFDASDETKNHDTVVITSGRIEFEITITQIEGDPNDWNDGGGKDTELG